ncbi:5-bromo-4-chloroindolyl phosphate hydrolysis family protein [Faecalibacterium sp. An121]|uniref:5-bromo-4-chloroindolyl phosphate hydrolysis family protein n=1 Tax=Faecalibacterium sp. An121 TaxID=1965550 RepID=UPI000B378720|nr:5-bromo-4-chloroindolyl phosphate hydrolysis family protein [Faecalibacterium sp. An121]OUQ40844.1 5-bromo-4-chloroindolyl phosphate hydrolysis protein [Faecalibacterium sp. An121]
MQPEHKHYFARIPTIFLLVLLGTVPWLAVVLFILRTIDRDAEKKERNAFQESQFAGTAFRPQEAGAPKAAYDYSVHYTPDGMTADEQRKSRRRQQTLIKWCTVLGGLVLLAGVLSLPESIYYSLWNDVFSNLTMIVGGGGALALGLVIRRSRRLERQLDKVVGGRDNIPLDELFAAAGLTEKEGRKVLENAIDHGYFGTDAYIDNRTGFLVVRGPAPIPAQPAPEPQPDAGGETQYQKLLRQLHQAGQAITDPDMKGKADRLEQVSARIFALAEADPDKEEQLRKFTSYYLPTSLKLLHTYAQLDSQGVDGENIAKTKQSIERSLDLLVTAFENQLDKLFQSDALDVSADIAALEGMLSLDGLSGHSDFTSNPS